MRGAERVVDVDVGKRSELLGKLGIVLGLALFKADVFEQQDLALLQGGSLGDGVLTDDVVRKDHVFAEKLGQTLRDGRHGELRVEFALRAAEVGAKDQLCAVVQQVVDGGQGLHDPLVGRDDAVFHLDVEVAAYKDLLALHVDIFDGFLVERAHVG